MEQLIHDLNDPLNQGAPERIQDIQQQIQQQQRDKSAWQIGLDLLNNDNQTTRFYGALTLTIKINADWDQDGIEDDPNAKMHLLQALVSNYVRLSLSGDAKFVLQKLCSTLAALYQRLASEWHAPVHHILACLVGHQYVSHTQLPPTDEILQIASHVSAAQLIPAVRFAATLAEDTIDRPDSRSDHIEDQLGESCGDCFKLLQFCLTVSHARLVENAANTSAFTYAESIELGQISIQAVQVWHKLLQMPHQHRYDNGHKHSSTSPGHTNAPAESASQALATILGFYEQEPMRGSVLLCLSSVQQTSPKLLIDADPAFPQPFMESNAVRQTVNRLLENTFDSDDAVLVELLEAIMSHVDSTTPEYMASGRLARVLEVLQLLLRCQGIAMIDEAVSQVVLEIVNQLVEGRADWTDEANDQKVIFNTYVQQACESCLIKIMMPIEEMSNASQTWDADDRSGFSSFRLDVQDFLQAAYAVLGPSLPGAIVSNLTRKRDENNWPTFEASLFSLNAFADVMSEEPEKFSPFLELALGCQYFQAILLSSEAPDQARKTAMSFLSEITFFLKGHQDIMQILAFLFSSLQLPASAGAASRAIYTLCYEQRSSLVEALPGFLAALDSMQGIDGTDRHRIYGGVAAIIQALKSEPAKVEPISRILHQLSSTPTGAKDADVDEGALVAQATDLLRSMAAVGRGLRVPNDVPIDIDASIPSDAGFWTTGPGSQVQQQAVALYQQALSITREPQDTPIRDSEFTEAACDFLRSGLTEDHPSPFKFPLAVSTKLVVDQISLDSANMDAVLGCASCLLALADGDEMKPHLPALMSTILSNVSRLLSAESETQRVTTVRDSSLPSATLDFMARMLPKWSGTFFSLDKVQEAVSVIIEMALIVLASPDTLPRRSAAPFFAVLVNASSPQKSLTQAARDNINGVLQSHSPRIVAVLLRLVAGECARSELEVISDPIRQYVQSQPMIFKTIGKEAIKEESNMLSKQALKATTMEQRSRFIAQLDALRGNRKTKEVVKEFWIMCRGSGLNYIA